MRRPLAAGETHLKKTETSREANPTSLFQYRDFLIFWTGSFISGIGSQFTTVAMAWQLYELTNSAFPMGLLGLVRGIPQIALLLFAGLLADAINRRKLMMCTQIGLFGVSTMLAVLTLMGKASPGMLYVATMLLAVFTSLETPSRQSITPNLVPRKFLARALALQGTQRYVPNIAGPSLAGIVLAVYGPAACYMADAMSWLVMLASLGLLRTKLQEGRGWGSVSLGSLREGFKFVTGHGVIFPFTRGTFCLSARRGSVCFMLQGRWDHFLPPPCLVFWARCAESGAGF